MAKTPRLGAIITAPWCVGGCSDTISYTTCTQTGRSVSFSLGTCILGTPPNGA